MLVSPANQRPFLTDSVVVKRAIDISREFEATSRAREQAMRVSEALSLTSQADAAFLARLADLGLGESGHKDPRQLARTLATIRKAFVQAQEAKGVAGRAGEEVVMEA